MKWLCCGKYCQNTAEDINSLDYSHSLLHEIPTEIYLFERTLEKLYLDSNRILELPKQLFNCDELRILNLSDNEISFLPPAVSLLINLQNLDISKNALTKIPENLRSCLCLSVLDLSINPLERFPESVISLVSLKELYLTDVCLEFLPANFGKLVNLRILELRENNLSTLPRTMSRLIHLTRLDIGNNEFTSLPEVISSFHNINELWIDGNHIKKLNRSIGQLRRMNHFEASNNKIASLPNEIGYWTKIVELSLSNNEITQLPSTIGNMKNLVSLKLDNNNLKALPNTLGKLVHLEELMINHNFISHLPASVGLLRKLQVLIADKNKLVSIPPELGSCSSLSIVSVQDNQISTMPAEIGHLCSLRVLNLVNNHLSYLPVSLLKLEKLAALWLSNNQSQPLVPLQQEISSDTHQMVLTCFMLPQISYKHVDYSQEKPYNSLNQVMEPNRRIYFANDISVLKEQPYKLLRAPTPYPKELRTLAKHAKNYQQGVNFFNKESQNISTMHNAVQIKEAKVAVTSNNIPTNETNLDCSRLWDKHVYISDEKVTSLSETIPVEASLISDDTSLEQNECSVERYALSLPILTRKSSPLIRKAKNIRTDIQNQCSSYETDNIKVPVNSFSTHNDFRINLNHTNILQLPTYRITAFNTQQSHYFNSLDYSHYMSLSCIDKKLTSSDVDYVIMQNSNACTDSNKLCELTNITNIQNSIHESEFYGSNKNNFTLPHSSNTKNSLENQTDYKLRTFIQDKPSPSQYIIAPTPKRPVGLKKSIIMPFLNETGNVKKSLLHLNNPVCQSTNKLNFQKHKRGNDSQKKLMSTNFNELQKVSVLTNKGKCVLATNTLINWAFGPHKNATVIQVTIQKSSELGFTISEKQGQGIFVESVASNGPARNILKAGDKILEVDGVDFREINEKLAINILHSSSKFINMMISHMN